MFRSGESFRYTECANCGCLQITAVPADLSAYYGDDYYSFQRPQGRYANRLLRNTPARAALRVNTAIYNRFGKGWGIEWARQAGMRATDRIIDVGSGGGENLLRMHAFGYRNLVGADPFLDRDKLLAPGVPVLRRHHTQLDGQFDWIMMHHAFEHVGDPGAVLESFERLLAPGGRVLLRVPLVGGYAWREYGTSWVQIDAPRHLVLFSLSGLRQLVERAGFELMQVRYDSWSFQFWGSELVRRGIAYADGPVGFSDAQLDAWAARAVELNRALDGDQAAIVLRRA
jgi:SAM-dependent methyltransferase